MSRNIMSRNAKLKEIDWEAMDYNRRQTPDFASYGDSATKSSWCLVEQAVRLTIHNSVRKSERFHPEQRRGYKRPAV